MIDWLRKDTHASKDPWADPRIDVAGRSLPITIRRHKRATRLTMRLAPDASELRITLPSWGRSLDAFAFAKDRTEWIAAQLDRVPAAQPVMPGASLPFRGDTLALAWQAQARRAPVLQDSQLVLGGPQDRFEARVRKWLEGQALAQMAQDLAFYCHRAQHDVPELRLSRARRRWGSCASGSAGKPCIRINWRLIMAPDHVRRSVVAHEVAHLTYFDHSPAFHAHLGQLFDADIKAADAWLKAKGRTLYACFA